MKTLGNANTADITKVIYLMAQNPYTDRWEVMAYFPEIKWGFRNDVKMSYMHNGQHGPCLDSFALIDCIAPRRQHMAAVHRLHKELEDIGYNLLVLDSNVWLNSNGTKKKELIANVKDATAVKDSELLMAGTPEMRRAIRAAAMAS